MQSETGKVGWLSSLKAGSVLVVALLSQAMLGTFKCLTNVCRINDGWEAMQW